MHYGNENLIGKCQMFLNINFIYAKYENIIIKIAFFYFGKINLYEYEFIQIKCKISACVMVM